MERKAKIDAIKKKWGTYPYGNLGITWRGTRWNFQTCFLWLFTFATLKKMRLSIKRSLDEPVCCSRGTFVSTHTRFAQTKGYLFSPLVKHLIWCFHVKWDTEICGGGASLRASQWQSGAWCAWSTSFAGINAVNPDKYKWLHEPVCPFMLCQKCQLTALGLCSKA